MEVLTDLLLEKWKNFPEARQLGDESAHFIRAELESTWGQSHLSVLSKEEAQKWLLGVSTFFSCGTKDCLWSSQNCHNIVQGIIGRLNTKNKQVVSSFVFANHYITLFDSNSGVPYQMVL